MKYILLLLFFSLNVFGQTQTVFKRAAFRIDSLPKQGIVMNNGWKWHAGDNAEWAKVGFDASKWDTISPTHTFTQLPQVTNAEIGWFRLEMDVDSALLNQPLMIDVTPYGALEIYLNGKLIHKAGIVSKDPNLEKAYSGDFNPINFYFFHSKKNVIAVRYSLTKSNSYFKNYIPFALLLIRPDGWQQDVINSIHKSSYNNLFLAGLILMMVIIHLCFYYYYPTQKANLFFSVALFLLFFSLITNDLSNSSPSEVSSSYYLRILGNLIYYPQILFYLVAVYYYLQRPLNVVFGGLVAISLFFFLLDAWRFRDATEPTLYFNIVTAFVFVNYMFAGYQSMKAGNRSAKFLLYGGVVFFIITVFMIFELFNHFKHISAMPWFVIFIITALRVLCIPISVSLALARDFAQTNHSLQAKLTEVQQLSEEKQHLLASQNETLEKQVAERTAELEHSLENLKQTQNQLIQKEKLASLGELTAGIAHEIQNPLNFVNNFAEVSVDLVDEMQEELDKGNPEEAKFISNDIKQILQKITHHGKRASSIVKNMLEHSRVSTGERVMTDINALADEFLRLSYHGLRAKDKTFNSDFKMEFDENLPKISVVPQDIGRVLLNLINNAFYAVSKGTAEKGMVIVSTKNLGDKIEIRVKDNGQGIAKENLEKILHPFFTTKPTGEGTGLGLSLSYEIVTKGHNGTFEVKSEEGKGAEFIVKLPIVHNV